MTKVDGLPLTDEAGHPWDGEIATLPIVGACLTEVEFCHRASRTLILAHLIEYFEPRKVGSAILRLLAWVGGVSFPHGGTSRDLRLNFPWRRRRQVREAVRTMLAWAPERVIFAHGR